MLVSCSFPWPYTCSLLFCPPPCMCMHVSKFLPNWILLSFSFGTYVHLNVRKMFVQRSSCISSRKVHVLLSVCTNNFSLHICVYVGLCVLFQIYFSIKVSPVRETTVQRIILLLILSRVAQKSNVFITTKKETKKDKPNNVRRKKYEKFKLFKYGSSKMLK